MLLRRAAQTSRPYIPRISTLSTSILVLLALCVALPFVLYTQHSSLNRLSQQRQPPATPLQRLQQQRASEAQQLDPSTPSRHDLSKPSALATAEQIAAASRYLHSIQHPKQRPAVPAVKYVLDPEPFEMRQRHRKVRDEKTAFNSMQSTPACCQQPTLLLKCAVHASLC
jgi:hypothetical protein